jgi:hypothetical protein
VRLAIQSLWLMRRPQNGNIKDLKELISGPNIENISRTFTRTFNNFAF